MPGGYNSGRSYHLQAASGLQYSKMLAELAAFSHQARKRAESSTRFAALQRRVRRIYHSRAFQAFSIACILMVRPGP